jgi:hypothetical protein
MRSFRSVAARKPKRNGREVSFTLECLHRAGYRACWAPIRETAFHRLLLREGHVYLWEARRVRNGGWEERREHPGRRLRASAVT